MLRINLTQHEADLLMEMEKYRVDDRVWYCPNPGKAVCIPLASADKKERFLLDMRRGKVNLAKATYQNRARRVIVLLRLDLGNSPHRNPDDEEVPGPHLHVYKEGFGDKWAAPVPREHFGNLTDVYQTLKDFIRFCNVVKPPAIRRESPA